MENSPKAHKNFLMEKPPVTQASFAEGKPFLGARNRIETRLRTASLLLPDGSGCCDSGHFSR